MPTIRPYQSQENAYTGGLNARASAAAFGGGIGQAVEGFGSDIARIGPVLQQAQDEQNKDKVVNGVSTFDATQPMLDYRLEHSTDAANAGKDTPNWYTAAVDAHIAKLGLEDNPRAAGQIRRTLLSRMPGVVSEQTRWGFGQSEVYGKQLADDGLTAVQNRLFANPNDYDNAITDIDAIIDRQTRVPPSEREAMKVKGHQQAGAWRFTALTADAASPEALDALEQEANSKEWASRLDPADHEHILNNIKSAKTAIQNEFNAQAQAAVGSVEPIDAAGQIIPLKKMQEVGDLVRRSNNRALIEKWTVTQINQGVFSGPDSKLTAAQLRDKQRQEVPPAGEDVINYLSNLPGGRGTPERITGLKADFASSLARMISDAPPEIRAAIGITSGYRSNEEQDRLFRAAVKKYGSREAASKWVAPPGYSRHNSGDAADLSWNGEVLSKSPVAGKAAQDWFHAHAAEYGLRFRMDWEPWHIELAGGYSKAQTIAQPTMDGLWQAMAAVTAVESGGAPTAISPAGAAGLMQVMPETAPEIAHELGDKAFPYGGTREEIQAYLASPDVGARYGQHYFVKQFNAFGGDLDATLVAYNAGPATARKWVDSGKTIPLPQETQDYIIKVKNEMRRGGVSDEQFYTNRARQVLIDKEAKYRRDGNIMQLYADTQGLPDLDGTDPANWSAMAERARAASHMFEVPTDEMTPFTADDADVIRKAMKDGDSENAVAILGAVAGMGDMAKGAAKQLGQTDPTFAYAANVYASGNRGVANDIVRGQKVLEGSGDVKGTGINEFTGDTREDLVKAFDAILGNSVLDLQTRKQIFDAATAHMVQSYYGSGAAVRGEYNAEAFTKSIDAVMGGTEGLPAQGEVNGAPVILPRGVVQKEVETALDLMTIGDYKDASVDGNLPQYLNPVDEIDVNLPADIAEEGKFVFVATDIYKIQMNDGSFLITGTLPGGEARPYMMRLSKKLVDDVLTRSPPPPAPATVGGITSAGEQAKTAGAAAGAAIAGRVPPPEPLQPVR